MPPSLLQPPHKDFAVCLSVSDISAARVSERQRTPFGTFVSHQLQQKLHLLQPWITSWSCPRSDLTSTTLQRLEKKCSVHHGKYPIILTLKAAKLRDGSSSSDQALTFRFDHKSTYSFLQKPNLPTSCNSTQNLTVFVLFTVIFALLYSELHSFCTRTIIYMAIVVISQALSTIIITRKKNLQLFISV